MSTRNYAALATAAVLAVGASAYVGDAAATTSPRPLPATAISNPAAGSGSGAHGRSHPVEDPYYPGKSNPEIDTLHYGLDLAWDGTVLTGRAAILFRPTLDTDTVRLDLIPSLRVSSVELDGAAISYTHPGSGLVLDVGQLTKHSRHTLTIDYAGKPHTVKAPSHRGDELDGLGWTRDQDGNVYTFQEPYGAFTWYPVNDHPSDKAMYDAQITVPDGDTGIFNGMLETQRPAANGASTFVWHLARPVASYLTTIAIGPYTAHHDTMPDGTPATYWLLPRDEGELSKLQSQTQDAFGWLTKHAGRYPFSTFGTVVVGGTSAMETQTLVTMSRTALDRPDAVVEHEMAHQWYGDAVSPTNWVGLWLNEGWAMWMQQAYEKYRGGYEYLGGMSKWRPYDEQSRERSGPPGHYDRRSFGDLNVYLGPAMMLDRIRRQVGNAEFTNLSAAWVKDHEYGDVNRHEFISWVNAQTGKDFTSLIDRWLDSRHTPGGG